MFGNPEVCTEDAIVATDDCELDLAGLPGRTENIGAGDGCDCGTTTGDAFVREGDAEVVVGVGKGVLLIDVVFEIFVVVIGKGLCNVGRDPV